MSDNVTVIQGNNTVAFVRPLAKAATDKGALVPFQTGAKLDLSRSSKNKDTKSGSLATLGSLEGDFELDFIDSTDATSDAIFNMILEGSTMEVWLVETDRKNSDGKYFAWYMHAIGEKDSVDAEADAQSTRKVKMKVQGTPQRGWTPVPPEVESEIQYVFMGLDSTTTDAHGNGVAFDENKDAGVSVQSGDKEVPAGSSDVKPLSSGSTASK